MNADTREQLRADLLNQAKSDSESVVDLVLSLMDKVEALTKRVEQLENQLKKNSGNSSQPPSSDTGGARKPKNRSLRGKSGKKSGGQPGHRGLTLKRCANPDETIEHRFEFCPQTGRSLSDADVVSFIRRSLDP